MGVIRISNRVDKPKKTSADLVAMLRDEKGVGFSIVSETDAIIYFQDRNNYLRTASYRKNYLKHTDGAKAGKYINLEFAYLKELSTVDMHLRGHLLQMCIDVEHALKVDLVSKIERDSTEDGYTIVDDFLSQYNHIKRSIERKAGAIFTGDLIAKYFVLKNNAAPGDPPRYEIVSVDCPIWVLVEIITFGDLVKLYNFYCGRHPGGMKPLDENILNPVRSLRNACAHNNCLLTSLAPHTGTAPNSKISLFVSRMSGIGDMIRRKKLKCRPLFEIVCLLYCYTRVVSDDVRKNRLDSLKAFVDGRLVRHMGDYFAQNNQITTALFFLQKVVDNLA